ncbi:sugar kinase, ribokinase family [Longilinea arvoryzae]|uniref:Sugar kinase, ribokinase family n=1 Tax=Longilinea arvoryzae TaxID=360412 RepID=A0A0S7BLI8_9CHLR|nr:carbohydrate kinase family protein [Longilinea arvoryzae]GAP14801.1 sugar kinase, ribokinase family [Longilinea arvoryzae]
MNKPILVSGLINIETALRISSFPLEYFSVTYPFFGISSSVSGVGYNIAKALTVLGDRVRFLSIIGQDIAAQQVRARLIEENIAWKYVLNQSGQTAQSVILFDESGRRQIHTDLKNIQELTYPLDLFDQAVEDADICALCNINYSRPLLQRAKSAGRRVATDVHTISDLEDEYNRDFMQAADILFQSDERLPVSPEDWVCRIWNRYPAEIVVVGLGKQGALLGLRNDHALVRIPAVRTRPIVNTIGAGDALFSSFLHGFNQGVLPFEALQKAVVFASYKIGVTSASDGFLTAQALEACCAEIHSAGAA